MKQKKYFYPIIVALVILVAGFYTIDSNSKEASVFSMPDISGTTHIPKADKQPVQSLQQFNDAIVNIADQTTPAVVTIRVTQTVEAPENPFARFFGEQGGPSRERKRRGLGSGVIVSNDGYILTNNHVVENADKISVDLKNGETYKGKVIGRDPETDVAVVKIDADNLQAIKIGNSDGVRVGEMVLAIGSPLGDNLAHSVSMGIISAKDRSIGIIEKGAGYENFLQTDAAINPGNSGGALVNMDGELIGINSAIASKSGGNDGIGFAVPSNLAKSIMKSLINNGKVVRAQLGIYGRNIDRALARGLDLKSNQGILVNSVLDDSPAGHAGLKEGDVIRTMNGNAVGSYSSFRTTIATSKPGRKITLGIVRNGHKKDVEVTLGERSDEASGITVQGSDMDMQKHLGFRIEKLTNDLARQLDLEPGQHGVIVQQVNDGSNAARKGVERGDVITKVNKQPIKTVADFNKAIQKLADEDNPVVLLQVIKQGQHMYIAFEL